MATNSNLPSPRADDRPPRATTLNALAELSDVAIAAQSCSDHFDKQGRPYLRFRARELESEVHDLFFVLELLSSGWEPTNHVDR